MDKEYYRHLKAKYSIDNNEVLECPLINNWTIEYSISLKKFYIYARVRKKWFYLRPNGIASPTCGAEGFYDIKDDCYKSIHKYMINNSLIDFIDKKEMEL